MSEQRKQLNRSRACIADLVFKNNILQHKLDSTRSNNVLTIDNNCKFYGHFYISVTCMLSCYICMLSCQSNTRSAMHALLRFNCFLCSDIIHRCSLFYRLCIYVLPLEIQLSSGESWNPINWFNPATLLCMSQTRTYISNVYICFFFIVAHFLDTL
jgi:hypothetical protein